MKNVRKDRPPVASGQILELRPVTLVAGGESLSRIEGFPIFVRGLYQGDLARVEITELHKGFARGLVVELLEASTSRRAAPCPVSETCGGCDWTSLRLDVQLQAKKEILLSSLERVGKFRRAQLPAITIHPSPLRYRLRSRLHVSDDGELGFFAMRSHRVIPLPEQCEVVGPAVIEHLPLLRELAARRETTAVETFEHAETFTADAVESEASPVEITVGAHRYHLSTRAFFQVNRHLLPALLRLAISHAERARGRGVAFDLYAGVGFFTLPLSRIFDVVYGVEGAEDSHSFAKVNAQGYDNIRLFGESVETFLRRRIQPADFVMVDPPRAGLGVSVIESIDSSGAGRICYLSCDPVTFARDAGRLTARGWKLTSLDLLDLFPNTHHVETLSSFERAG